MIAQNQALAVSPSSSALTLSDNDKMVMAGQLANQAAAGGVFDNHLRHKAEETRKAYAAAVSLFSDALGEIGINRTPDQLLTDPEAWHGVTWAMVQGFRDMLLNGGLNKKRINPDTGERETVLDDQGQPIPLFFAIGSVNQRLSIIRKLADLAGQSGVIGEEERLKIRGVGGYTRKAGKRANEQREETRISNQKGENNFLTRDQVNTLLESLPETPQGRRDQLMLAMLIYLGMRVSELVNLSISDIDLVGGIVHIYRQKTDSESQLDMPRALRETLRDYLEVRPQGIANGRLLAASQKGGELVARPMSKRAVQGRIQTLGADLLDIDNLSPHDMRHSLAETFAQKEISEAAAMDVLGWSTSAMYHHYRKRTKVVSVPDVWK